MDSAGERIKLGLDQARAEAKRVGRPPALSAEQLEQCRQMAQEGAGLRHMARVLGCSPATVRKALALDSRITGLPRASQALFSAAYRNARGRWAGDYARFWKRAGPGARSTKSTCNTLNSPGTFKSWFGALELETVGTIFSSTFGAVMGASTFSAASPRFGSAIQLQKRYNWRFRYLDQMVCSPFTFRSP